MIVICINENGIRSAADSPLRISEMKKFYGLLLQIDIEGDPDFQMRLDADDVWIQKKTCSSRPERKHLATSNVTENAVTVWQIDILPLGI